MDLNTSNRVNENERHEKIAVIANDLSNWRYYSHNGEDTAGAFPVIDENKYSANIAGNGTVTIKKKQVGGEISFDSTYLADIDNIKNNVPKNEKEEAWQKADWYLAENILRAIEKAEKEENDKKASTKKDLGTTLEGANGFGKGFSLESLISMFKKTGFDRTKLFGDTKINPVSATANNSSSAKKSPDNSPDKVQPVEPVESSQSQIDSNIDINDIIHKIIEEIAPKGKESIDALKATCQPMIIEIMIHDDGTATVKTGAQRTHANSSSNRVEPVEGEEPILLKRESQKTKPVSSNFSGIKNAIADLKKAAAATQEAQEPNQELINMVNKLSQMNKQVKDAKVDIPTPNHDAAVENERKKLEEIGAIMDSYNTMLKGIPGIIAGIDKTTTGNEEKIADITTQLESLGRNIEGYIEKLTKEVAAIKEKYGTENHDPIIALCEKLQKLAGTFEKATAAVSGTGNKTPEKKDNKWNLIKDSFKDTLSTIKKRGKEQWTVFKSHLDKALSTFGEKAQQWGNKFTTLLQKFITEEKDYDEIKGEIEKEQDLEIKGLLLAILDEVKKITEQLKTTKKTNMDTDMDTETTETPAQNGGNSGGKVSNPQAVVVKPEPKTGKSPEEPKTNPENKVTVTENKDTAEDDENKKAIYASLEQAGLYKDGKIIDDTEDKAVNSLYIEPLKGYNQLKIFYLDKKPILVKYIDNDLTYQKNLKNVQDYHFFYSINEGKIDKRVSYNNGVTINSNVTSINNSTNNEEIANRKQNIKDLLNKNEKTEGKVEEKQAIIHAPISAKDPQMYDKLLGGLKSKSHKQEENVENPENEGSVPQKRENHETNNLTDVPVNQGNISSTDSNTQGKENPTPNTSQPAKKTEKKGALSRFSAQVREKITKAWNWFKGLFKKDKKNNSPKNATTKENMTDTRKSEMEYTGKLKLKKGEQYCNKDGEVIFTVSEVNGDNITLIYEKCSNKLEMNKTRQEVENIVKQYGYKKK